MIKTLYIIITFFFVYSFTGFLGKTEMGENREKITYYTKKYTKITLLGFIRKPYEFRPCPKTVVNVKNI